ncbi:MAG TPA: hypothetical protein VKC11_12520 [Steroidobacteraceae bacterium]|nr:hypothetical protein [Steroidobacteraceae bacterium]
MKGHIAAAAAALMALGAAGQVQAGGWDTGRSHGSGNRHYERADHRGWQQDRRGGDSRHHSWRDADRDHGRGSWRDGYRDRYWAAPRGWYEEGRYWRPHYRYYDYDYDDYGYYNDSDISLLISLPLQF